MSEKSGLAEDVNGMRVYSTVLKYDSEECDNLEDELSARAKKRIKEVKRRARPELHESWTWTSMGFANNFTRFMTVNDCMERIDVNEISKEQFIEFYEKPYNPVVIMGVQNNWSARQKWTLHRLRKKYRNQKFKCGEDNHGYSVKMKMKYFVDYLLTTQDDSPLYIFDSGFGEV
uniref:Bifunctional arginine demethylase and lysyl-hydroxylase JMJD6 n=2 Tax=Lygus hesperus TaxID=30085 RepID=A0A0A9XG67_LYGHE